MPGGSSVERVPADDREHEESGSRPDQAETEH
jgi:hypothetical protein